MVLTSSKPENGIEMTAAIPAAGLGSTGFWGTVSAITGMCSPPSRRSLDDALTLRAPLEQPVDDDDVGPHLLDLRGGPAAVRDDVDQPDGLLGVEEAADVLRHLRHVLHEEEADLV